MAEAPYKVVRFGVGQIPAGLLRDHSLKEGTRGRLTVLSGRVRFVWADGRAVALKLGESVEIPPVAPHHIEPDEAAAVEVAFFRA